MPLDNMQLNDFIELETGVWDALVRGDPEADARLLAEDFLGVYPSGFADRSDHVRQLGNGPTVSEFELHEARLMVLSDNDVLLCYRAESRGFASGPSAPIESMYVSSLWTRRADQWLNVFSQDTPAVTPSDHEAR